jgi:transcriptional regulator with XRE-family HTH domain
MERPGGMSVRIKEARQARGWSQQDLAERIGVSQPTIVHWEQGTHTPRNLALARLADALGVSRQWLQGDSEVQAVVAASRTESYLKNTSPIQAYLASTIHHIPIYAGDLTKEDVENCIQGRRPAIHFMPVAISVFSAFGLIIDDSAVERRFPRPTIAVIEAADRTLVDGKTYLVMLDGVARLRRWGAYPARFEADIAEHTVMVQEPPDVLGRLIVALRQY